MAWYRTGTVALTNGSATVTGSGTAFIANASIGEGFLGPDARTYEITNIASDTSLTINPAYLGSGASGQSYAIAPLRGRIADLIAETSSLLSSFASVRDGIGAGLFPDGSAATPAFRFTNDQDTGLYRSGTNTIAISTAGSQRLLVTATGNVGIGRDPDAYGKLTVAGSIVSSVDGGTVAAMSGDAGVMAFGVFNSSGSTMTFSTAAAGSGQVERMRITSAGNVGIGTNSPGSRLHVVSPSTGDALILQGPSQTIFFYQDSANIGLFNVASAGAGRDGILITSGSVQLDVNATPVAIATTAGLLAGSDNTYTLGGASNRWSVVYAGTGTINTSDNREKTWRGALNADELAAAKRIIAELGIYQWNDAIADKGPDEARLHFGVRAQQVFDIMEDEGLDWGRYAWCCYDQWDEQTQPILDEDGEPTGETTVTLEAGDRYGIRPDQLAFWLIAAQADIQADLDARLSALEAA